MRGTSLTIPAEQVSSFPINPDDRVMLLDEWRRLRNVSPSGERRMRKKGLGPKLTHLTERRLGVTVRHDREWIERGGATHGELDRHLKAARSTAAGPAEQHFQQEPAE
jgi:hypothetical protein